MMTYEEVRAAFLAALREARLQMFDGPSETLNVTSMARTWSVDIEPVDRLTPAFFRTSASISWMWERQNAPREDKPAQSLRRDNPNAIGIEPRFLRVDITFRARLLADQPASMPRATLWARWAQRAVERLEVRALLVAPHEVGAAGRGSGPPERLVRCGEPSIEAMCGTDAEMRLAAITLPARQSIDVPDVESAGRKADVYVGEQLVKMFERLGAALHEWTEFWVAFGESRVARSTRPLFWPRRERRGEPTHFPG